MLNVERLDKVEFEKIMKRRRMRTYFMLGIIVLFCIYIVGIFSHEYELKKRYTKFLINMDAGNFDIREFEKKRIDYEKKINIQEIDYELEGNIESGNSPKSIIIHHTAADGLTPENINIDHKNRGYGGIGYHFYIRKDGTVYRGRGEEYIGAHTIGRNYDSIGVCLEGNFENEGLNEIQERSLIMLLVDMVIKYNISDIEGHRNEYQTLCPGKNISIEDICNKVKDELIEIAG